MTATQLAEVRPFASLGPCIRNSSLSERVDLMCASSLFAGLTTDECTEIASCAKARTYARNELLFMQGQPVRNILLIELGSVKLTQLSPNGAEVILWMNGEREAVGMNIDQHSSRHTCSARAMEQCRVLVWEYSRLEPVLIEHPQIRTNINRILSSRLQELEERFREIATELVARRLALTLLRLMKQIGRPHQEGTRVSLSREELAQMLGTTLFTISRILSKWAESGLVLARREAVVVRDARQLQMQADAE